MSALTVPLGTVCHFIGGGTPSKAHRAYYEGNIPWATVRDMRGDVISDTDCKISDQAVLESSTNILPAGTVVIATRVGLGKVSIVAQPTAINQDLRGVVPNQTDAIDSRFLFWWFKSVGPLIVAAGSGATVQGVRIPFLSSLPFPQLPLVQQQRIGAMLDEAIAGIEEAASNTRSLAGHLADLHQALINNFVFGETQSDWETILVGELVREKDAIRTGPFGSQLLHSEFVDQGVAVLGIDNVVANEFRWSKRRFITTEKYEDLRRYTVRPGDVLISIMGTCGRCAVVPDDIPLSINTKHLCCISVDVSRCLPEYLHLYFLHHPNARRFLQDRAKGSIMAGLNMGIIKELPVQLPDVKEQELILARHRKIDAVLREIDSAQKRKLTALAELKQSLLSRAFSGELRQELIAA